MADSQELPDQEAVDLLFKLVEQNGTMDQARSFLKERGLTHSASSWEQLIEDRYRPALQKGDIGWGDLLQLLAEVEEHGSQHIFMFQCPHDRADSLIRRDRVENLLHKIKLGHLIDRGEVVDQPSHPTFSEVRWEEFDSTGALVIKITETRTYRRFLDEEVRGNVLTRRYEYEETRGVHVIRLRETGLLEMRISSHRNTSKYHADIDKLWNMIGPILPAEDFELYPLTTAKNNLWLNRKALSDTIRFSDSTWRNTSGTVLSAATGRADDSLYADAAAVTSVDEFLRSDASCDRVNVWWLESDAGLPSRNLHVLLAGEANEFAINARCSKEDYDHVLIELEKSNR